MVSLIFGMMGRDIQSKSAGTWRVGIGSISCVSSGLAGGVSARLLGSLSFDVVCAEVFGSGVEFSATIVTESRGADAWSFGIVVALQAEMKKATKRGIANLEINLFFIVFL